MRAGNLDRRIAIQRKSITQSDSGEEVVTWTAVATVWAEKLSKGAIERMARQQIIAEAQLVFLIRWSDTVKETTAEHRIVFDGRECDIVGVEEFRRREGLLIGCTARGEQPVAP
jgi:SPP1 family predicted phage head-tail adaptor